MVSRINSSPVPRGRDLRGQVVVVIGGSSGIGLETARLARAHGADMILTAREPDRLYRAGLELAASIAAFDATDSGRLRRFFDALAAPVDHVLVAGPGSGAAPSGGVDADAARRDVGTRLLLPLQVARNAAGKVVPGGTMLFVGSTGGRRPAADLALAAALTAGLPAMVRSLALEVAPVRVNLIVAGAAGGGTAGQAGIAALAVHLMTNTAITGATIDIGGQQLIGEGEQWRP
jgi:NAD(P)-dependent dehydrogenase (short-subunit alcohol dehydrogenase family)